MATTTNTMGAPTLSQQQMNRRLYWGIAIALIVTLGIFYSIRAARERAAGTSTPVVTEPAPRVMDTRVNRNADGSINDTPSAVSPREGLTPSEPAPEPATNP